MAKGLSEVLICDVCGYIWLQSRNSKAETLPDRCRNRECRSPRWNSNPQKACSYCGKALSGKQQKFCSRRHKELAKINKQRGNEIWIGEGNTGGHHVLCACIVCLAAICQTGKRKKGWQHQSGKRMTDEQRQSWRAAGGFGKGFRGAPNYS